MNFHPAYLEAATLILGLFLLMVEAFSSARMDKRHVAHLGIAGLAAVLAATFFAGGGSACCCAGGESFYLCDGPAMFYKRLALLSTIVVLVMAVEYAPVLARNLHGGPGLAGFGEYCALPVLACAGLMWMASAGDFILILVSLELVTVSFYVLVAYMRRDGGSLEAGVKYLILGALSTGFLIYGITWIYGMTGQTNLARIAEVASCPDTNGTGLLFGVLLVLAGLGFKIAAVPFQIWVPDVYQGAPTPTTAFLSVGSKAAGFLVLVRVIDTFAGVPALHHKVLGLAAVLALLTLAYGNLAALPQNNLKRLLAYSSIAHAGYLLVAVAAVSFRAISFYLGAYLLMTLLGFLVLVVVSRETGGDDISNFRGLAKRSPALAFLMLVAMVSLAGLPLTAGFIGKFFVFAAAVQQGLWALVAAGAVAVACGFYYYLKVVRAMYWQSAGNAPAFGLRPLTRLVAWALCAAILILGVYPQPLLALIK